VEDPEIPQKISTMEESNFTSFSRWSPSSYMGIAPQGNTLHPIWGITSVGNITIHFLFCGLFLFTCNLKRKITTKRNTCRKNSSNLKGQIKIQG
jgi:hypothetical protein